MLVLKSTCETAKTGQGSGCRRRKPGAGPVYGYGSGLSGDRLLHALAIRGIAECLLGDSAIDTSRTDSVLRELQLKVLFLV